jgi:hypothetical protein
MSTLATPSINLNKKCSLKRVKKIPLIALRKVKNANMIKQKAEMKFIDFGVEFGFDRQKMHLIVKSVCIISVTIACVNGLFFASGLSFSMHAGAIIYL